MGEQVAVLAGGCFWCTEAVFLDVIGVKKVESGYTGGTVANPSYKQVCGGDTGHAEAIRVTFDPDQLSYDDLLDIFFATHDPTQLNRQGNDVGTQYRSAIFPQDAEQERKAREAIERNNARPRRPHRHHDRAERRMVSGRRLSPGLLGGRGTAEPLLPRRDPAQAAEAQEELPGASKERGRDGLSGRAAQAVVDRFAESARRGWARRRCAALDEASASWRRSNSRAAASTRSPDELRLAFPVTEPNPIRYSSSLPDVALSRSGFEGA